MAHDVEFEMNRSRGRCFAIVPAAGRSRRMGKPKLLLPCGDGLLIDRVLAAWVESSVEEVFVITRQDDEALRDACRHWPVHLVAPDSDPQDMKESIQIGLHEIERRFQPADSDQCFLAPADLPTLTSTIIDQLRETEAGDSMIVVPQFGNKQGHPVLLPWPITQEIFSLASDAGIDRIVARHDTLPVVFPAEDRLFDVDTYEDYQHLKNRLGMR